MRQHEALSKPPGVTVSLSESPRPKLSVLIPTFNAEPFLAENLESLLTQDCRDFEIIVSDNCSNDGTCAVIERYAARDRRIRWWRNPTNFGMAANFNLCLREARGEYVKYVLADDKLLCSSALRRMVNSLESDASLALCASAAQVMDARSRLRHVRNHFGPTRTWNGREAIVRCLELNTNAIGEPSLVMFRRAQATRGFDERFAQYIDLEMWFYLLANHKFAFIAEPLCGVRVHPHQQTVINTRTRVSAGEHLMLVESYYPRPWLPEMATRKMLFKQVYYLRKHYGKPLVPVAAEMMAALGERWYAVYWLAHKIQRPLQNLRRWFGRRFPRPVVSQTSIVRDRPRPAGKD